MKLTVEDVARLTKLSVAAVRLHVAKKKLGTKEGNRRYFSMKDVETIKAGSRSAGGKKAAGAKKPAGSAKAAAGKKAPKGRKPAAGKRRGRPPAGRPAAPVAQAKVQSKPQVKAKSAAAPQPARRSFWSFLLPRPKAKISLLDAKIKK